MRRAARRHASKDTSEFSGGSSKKSTWKPSGENVKRTFPSSASSGSSSSGTKKSTLKPNVSGRKEAASGGGIKSKSVSGGSGGPSSAGRALPPRGATSATASGKPRPESQRILAMSRAASRGRKLLNKEDFEILAAYILEDLISEGYANTFEDALYVLESFSDYELGEIAESYLVEERVDLYDVVLEHLLDEGYADNEESATVIMTNMSEEWRNEILDQLVDF
jgi:hypothetical protein